VEDALHRLATGKSSGVDFAALDKICTALNCEPGDVLVRAGEKMKGGQRK
jgi:DNA-binding Xre family transcriptional regulator